MAESTDHDSNSQSAFLARNLWPRKEIRNTIISGRNFGQNLVLS